jgi:subtilisin family serine protease
MKTAITFLACLCLIALAIIEFPSGSHAFQTLNQQPSASRPAAPPKRSKQRYVPGEVLVRYRTESIARTRTGRTLITAPDGQDVAADVERRMASDLIPGYRVVHVDPTQTLKAIAALRREPDVLYAEPNYIMHALGVPNDPFFGEQYGLAKIGAQQVWDNFTTGSSEVVVAVVDQAIQINHQDLAANIWTNPAPGSVVVNSTVISGDLHGYDFKHNTGDLTLSSEAETHATHVAGIIGAVGNNNTGVTGVNWNVKLMSLKFLDPTGDGDTGDLIDALSYAKQMRDLWVATNKAQGANVRVINASFGDPAFSTPLQTTVNSLNSSGILVVAGASNTDNGFLEPNNDLVPIFPASLDAPNVISVAATDSTDALASFSHFGPGSVDIAAPGVGILSTTPPCQHPGPFPDFPCEPKYPLNFTSTQDTYSVFDGTSMSTPHVSGAAALLWAQNPTLTVKQVKDLLTLNGDVVPALVDKTLTGRRLNVFKSFQSLQENDATAPGAVTNLHLNVQNGRTLNIGWTASGDDGAGGGAAALYELSFVDNGTNAVTSLKGVVPAAPGTVQNTQITIPFRHTNGSIRVRPFDNKGNQGADATLPVVVSLLDGDPYIVTVEPNPAPLSTGGLLQDANGDDRYLDFLFPLNFNFPFFGQTFRDGVIISSNGNLFFSPPPTRKPLKPGDIVVDDADDPPGSRRALAAHLMIAGLWEDLDLSHSLRTDAGVYFLQPSPSQMIFRWQGVPCNFSAAQGKCLGGDPVNFEIELRTDGTIKMRYGSGNTGITPTVGIGGGDRDGYAVDSHTSEETEINLTNAREVTFTPRPQFSASVLDSSQVEMKSWKNEGRTFVYAKLTFPDAGYTVTDWGQPVRIGNAFSVNATIQHFNGPTPQAISNTAQIWDLGALAAGDYTYFQDLRHDSEDVELYSQRHRTAAEPD